MNWFNNKLNKIINENIEYKREYQDIKRITIQNNTYIIDYTIPYNATGQFLPATRTSPSEAPEIEKGTPEINEITKTDPTTGKRHTIELGSPAGKLIARLFHKQFNPEDQKLDQQILAHLREY